MDDDIQKPDNLDKQGELFPEEYPDKSSSESDKEDSEENAKKDNDVSSESTSGPERSSDSGGDVEEPTQYSDDTGLPEKDSYFSDYGSYPSTPPPDPPSNNGKNDFSEPDEFDYITAGGEDYQPYKPDENEGESENKLGKKPVQDDETEEQIKEEEKEILRGKKSRKKKKISDPKEMPFLDHLEEFRWRFIKIIISVIIGLILCFSFSDYFVQALIAPYEKVMFDLYGSEDEDNLGVGKLEKDSLKLLILEKSAVDGLLPNQTVQETLLVVVKSDTDSLLSGKITQKGYGRSKRTMMQVLNPTSGFMLKIYVALAAGLILALPYVLYQIWAFVAPGLLKKERRLVIPVLFLTMVCFISGGAMAYFVVIPLALRFLTLITPIQVAMNPDVMLYMKFVVRLILVFGVIFELPVATLLLAKIGLVTPRLMRRFRSYAIILIFVIAAFLTPPDPFTQLAMALPLVILYEVSILFAWIASSRRREAEKE